MKFRAPARLALVLSLTLLVVGLAGCTSLWESATQPFRRPDRAAPVFKAHDGAIFTPDGRPFVARGVNLQYGDRPAAALPALAAIASLHANIVRLELRSNTTAWQLRRALDEAVRLKLPVMLMYWDKDITCGTDTARLRQDVDALWLKRWAGVLTETRYQPYLMLNPANEWGTSKDGYAGYMAAYTDIIKAMRGKGFRMPIVIDAADCGQDTGSFLGGRAQTLQAADPHHNLIVSVHAYNAPWNSPALIDRHIADLKATGVPFLIGEFGDRELVENGNAVDHLYLMKSAQAQKVGWIAWSWKGNGKTTRVLDMSNSYATSSLTRRGRDIAEAFSAAN